MFNGEVKREIPAAYLFLLPLPGCHGYRVLSISLALSCTRQAPFNTSLSTNDKFIEELSFLLKLKTGNNGKLQKNSLPSEALLKR